MKKFLLSMLAIAASATSVWADELPYSQTFDTSAAFNTLTLWHADTDSRNWDYSSSAARFYPGSRYNEYDAWFFLPELNFEAGKAYVITFDTKISSSGSSNYKDLSVNLGTDATPEGQTELWRENIQSSSYSGKKVSFSVDADGAYRIGFRTNASSASSNDILVDNITIDAYKELPGKATDITATPGEKGALEVTLTWTNPAVNDGGTALSQLSGVNIYRTNSSWASMSENILIATVTDGIAPGETSTYVDTTVPASGTYYYYVQPFNDNGNCPLSISSVKTSGYVGPDAGLSATKNVVATAVEGSEKAIALTWDAPTGTNGGYVDPSGIAWKITRKGPATVVVAEEWTGELPYNFVDQTITELGAYTYTVQYINAGKTETTGATSNKVVTGGTAALPYSEDFTSSYGFDLYTAFNGENSTTTTKWGKPASYYYYVQLNQSSGTMDAWLVTPPFELKAGTYYDLEFSTSASATSTKAMEVMIGNEATAEGLTQSVFDQTLSLTSTMATNTTRFKADADGRFYIGFHAKGASGSGYFRLSNIKLSEVIVAPVAATDFTATEDPEGGYTVSLAWTNPATDVLGNELTTLTKVEVLRGEDVIKTYENAEAGAAMTLTDEVEGPGRYTYYIISYLGDNAGEPAKAVTGKVGGAMELPYNVEFTSEAAVADWTLPAIADGTTWKFDSSKGCLTAPDYKSGLWLFSPEFKAKKGTVKVVLCGASRSASYSETINVALYKSADPAAEPVTEVITYTFTSTSKTDVNFEFDVPENSNYTVGIVRPNYKWELYIYGASIEQSATVCETAPLAATDLTISADADDEALVHLSWVNPSKNVGGDDLAEISKIEVLRDGELIATLADNLVPGATMEYEDNVLSSGVFTYTVIVYNGEDASDPCTAKSPFIGGGFELPFQQTLSSASEIEFWTLPENENGKAWKYNSDSNSYRNGLVASSSNVKAYTVPFKAKKGKVTVTYGAASYNYNYRETLKVGLTANASFDASLIGDWQDQEVANSSYNENYTAEFEVPASGTYYICFYIETSRMYCYLNSIKIEQTEVAVENIVVLWDNTDAKFSKPTVEVNGEDIEMTPYVQPMLLSAGEDAPKTLDTNIYMAEIPGDAQSVKFKDGDEAAGSEPVEVENPRHMYIYTSDGSGKMFDEDQVTGIEDITVDNANVRYFDMRGVEVASPRQGGLYIVVRGQKATKELVK